MTTQTTQQPAAGSPNAPSTTQSGVPFGSTTHNYANAQAHADAQAQTIRIPDGRRNSQGEILPSPTESWKPKMNRVQSWNQEDLKRKAYQVEMGECEKGQGTGFTEGGAGTRLV
jgi:hypothetical protein